MQYKNCFRKYTGLLALIVLLTGGSIWDARAYDYQEEINRKLSVAGTPQPLGNDMFGDQVDWYTGGVTWRQVDVDIPGNNELPVRIARNFATKPLDSLQDTLGNWNLEVPYMSGLWAQSAPWVTNRCSTNNWTAPIVQSEPDPYDPSAITDFYPHEYWRGITVNIPGKASRLLLRKSANYTPSPTNGLSYQYSTLDHVQFTCLSSLKSGQAGEGFLAVAPDGTKYYFDWLVTRNHGWLTKPNINATAEGNDPLAFGLYRQESRLYATKVVDRFGNYVDYTYVGSQLTKIESNDGRLITLTYNTNGKVSQVSAHGSTWTYTYAYTAPNYFLTAVTLPDGKKWELPQSLGLSVRYQASGGVGQDPSCEAPSRTITSGQQSLVFKHPSGATGTFTFNPRLHARENLTNATCGYPPYYDGSSPVTIVHTFRDYSLTAKSITGNLMPASNWSINYQGTAAGGISKSVLITNPDLSTKKVWLGIQYAGNEGQLLKEEISSPTGAILQTTTHVWAMNPSSPPYAYSMGATGLSTGDDHRSYRQVPELSRTITRDGVSYVRETLLSQFNEFALPLVISRYSTSSSIKKQNIGYHHNYNLWTINQTATVTDDQSGLLEEEITYSATNALPLQKKKFGVIEGTYTWNSNGTLSTSADGMGRMTTYSNWKRGYPQNFQFSDASTYSAVISNLGWVQSLTNEKNATTNYSYDPIGRLTGIVYPSGDTVAWGSPSFTYVALSAAISSYGVPAGTWQREETNGRFRSRTYYDARWRPVLVEERDSTTGIYKFKRKAYDYEGRLTFSSLPSSASTATNGVVNTYDALGRITKRATESGTPLETIEYLTNYRIRTTDGDGKSTTITYQGYDEPNYTLITSIEGGENQTTQINRDQFGKITSVTQSGTWTGGVASATRTFQYNLKQQLCRRSDPETGSTIWNYNNAGQIVWELRGQSGTGCVTTQPSNAMVVGYDSRGRKNSENYPGTVDDVSYTYDVAGNLTGVSNSTAAWTYSYNKRNLLESEQVLVDGVSYLLDEQYNSLGHLSGLVTPARAISYAPDAWGRATTVGSFASNVQYHPNGTPSSYSHSNGASYTLQLDSRQRPQIQEVRRNGSLLQRYVYNYSTFGDLINLDDTLNSVDDVTATYDDLHRLESAAGVWGNYQFKYDTLNNVRERTENSTALIFTYNVNNSLSSITGPSSTTLRSYLYNSQGDVTSDGLFSFGLNARGQISSVSGVATYAYDGNGNRIKTVKGSSTEYALYDRSGRLVFTKNGGVTVDYLSLSGKTIAEIKRSASVDTPTFLHSDMLGSPRLGTNSAGAIAWQEHFDPYGKKLNGVSLKTGYTGHAYDTETGYTYAKARFYDPLVGRFLSSDPVHFIDDNPFTFNRYSYANNNPYSFVDPDGEFVAVVIPYIPTIVGWLATIGAAAPIAIAVHQDVIQPMLNEASNSDGESEAPEAQPSNNSGGRQSTLEVGPFAGKGVPADGPGRNFGQGTREEVNEEGAELGCHTCGSKDPGTKSGNYVPDHQPVSKLSPAGTPQRLYPQCLACSRQQGGETRAHLAKESKSRVEADFESKGGGASRLTGHQWE